jgi:hypothetical protein
MALKVIIEERSSGMQWQAHVVDDVPVERIVQDLIQTLRLPLPAVEGQPGEYVLSLGERPLLPSGTLASQQVKDGDKLVLYLVPGDLGLYIKHERGLTVGEAVTFLTAIDAMMASLVLACLETAERKRTPERSSEEEALINRLSAAIRGPGMSELSTGRLDEEQQRIQWAGSALCVVAINPLPNNVQEILLKPVDAIWNVSPTMWGAALREGIEIMRHARDVRDKEMYETLLSPSVYASQAVIRAFSLLTMCEQYQAVSLVLNGEEVQLGRERISLRPDRQGVTEQQRDIRTFVSMPQRFGLEKEILRTRMIHFSRHGLTDQLKEILRAETEISPSPEKPESVREEQPTLKADLKALEEGLLKLERYPRVDFPAKCVKGEAAALRVQLALHPQALLVLKALFVPMPVEQREATLLVTVHSRAFYTLDEPYKAMRVPIDRDSEVVSFLMMPYQDTRPGKHEITVGFFRGAQSVGSVVISTEISNPHSGGLAPFTGGVGGNDSLFALAESAGQFRPQATITGYIREERGNRYLEYRIITRDPSLVPQPGGKSALVDQNQGNEWIGQVAAELAQSVTRPLNREDYLAVRTRMAAFGRKLAELIPELTRRYIDALGETPWIQVYDPSGILGWIPWELVCEGEEFWAQRYILARLSENRNPGRSPYTFAGGLHALASYVSSMEAENIFSRTKMGAQIALQRDLRTHEFCTLAAGDGMTVIHLTCHGDTLQGLGPVLLLGNDPHTMSLTSDVVEQMPLRGCALVFANACESARIRPMLGHFVSFGEAFLKAGASAFIGTLAEVPAKPAILFSRRFYEYLDQGLPVGLALHHTRQEFADPGYEDPNPFWLFYSLYGDAGTSLKIGNYTVRSKRRRRT